MAIRQLSVFIENKKGSLHEITDILAKENIDLRSMCVADTADYGIVRIIVDDPIKALDVFQKSGHTANMREVTGFAVPDRPGGLATVLALLENNGIDIEYLYALITTSTDKAFAVMRTYNCAATEALLIKNNIELLEEENI